MATRQPDDPRSQVPADVLAAAVDRELVERRERAVAKRQEKRDKRSTTRLPKRGKYRAVSSGEHRRRSRPVAKVEDRQFVPGALRHFRMVHGLSMPEAQARIGYSPTSSTWRQWEDGVVAPPYLALLKIISVIGLGYWTEHGLPQEGTTADARLALLNTQHRQLRAARRRRRAARRSGRA
jgi:DNA-binding transcriptional regulator YiaG